MRPKDAKQHGSVPAPHHAALSPLDHPALPLNEGEMLTAFNLGECAEGPAANWETAWIDLGGEG
jgi:hypothetical protein